MRRIILSFLIFVFFILIVFTLFLATKGYETDRFNKFISNEIEKKEKNLNVDLTKIRVKIDLKNINLFLSTKNPKITYYNAYLPISEFSVYLDFLSLFKTNPRIKKTLILTDEVDILDFKKAAASIKPSNFKSFLLNNIQKGKFKSDIDLTFGENFEISNYQIKGYFKNTDVLFNKKIKIKIENLNFIADKEIILVNSMKGNIDGIPITNGNVEVNIKEDYTISGSINSIVDLNEKKLRKLIPKNENLKFLKNEIDLSVNSINNFNLVFSNTLELKEYSYTLDGVIENGKINLNNAYKSKFLNNDIETLNLKKTNIKFLLDNKKNILEVEGNYKLNDNKDYESFKVKNELKNKIVNLNISLNLKEPFSLDLINYNKTSDRIGKIQADLSFVNNGININSIQYNEGQSLISLNKFEINEKNQIKKFKNIKVKTFINGKENNNFEILFGKKLTIKGKSYDSSNLIKNINNKGNDNFLRQINKEVNISFENIFTKFTKSLNNFNLIGKIEKGKFVKISSKSEFSDDRYLDISLKKDPNTRKKILEIYSGFAKPLLVDFNFFKGIEGGQLLFTSIFDDKASSSNLQIKDFKVLNAPAFAKLLALADLSGPAVLLSGDGLAFDTLEIKFTDDKTVRTIEEIYAVGPSITILMEGYVENKSGLTSLRGTMVPAKEINKLISKIPVIGDILIGKEIGEGVFGVSFKMKGPPGKIKTTVNPIKTLTPRFITRALEKRKKKIKSN
ncbi:MAG: AsmA-like C-terminal domain-containing protein [Pelagibacteraceae bacterium]